MEGKIGLEEHFSFEDTIEDSNGFLDPSVWPELKYRLLDFSDKRLRFMDKYGMEVMILSLNAPAIQGIPNVKKAIEIAKKSNDLLAEQVAKRPDRFRALGALPMQDPEIATIELKRCIEDLNFCGVLVNGFSQIENIDSAIYLDLRQ